MQPFVAGTLIRVTSHGVTSSACTCPALARSLFSHATGIRHSGQAKHAFESAPEMSPHTCTGRDILGLAGSSHQLQSRSNSVAGISDQIQAGMTLAGNVAHPSYETPQAAALRLHWQTALLCPRSGLHLSLHNPHATGATYDVRSGSGSSRGTGYIVKTKFPCTPCALSCRTTRAGAHTCSVSSNLHHGQSSPHPKPTSSSFMAPLHRSHSALLRPNIHPSLQLHSHSRAGPTFSAYSNSHASKSSVSLFTTQAEIPSSVPRASSAPSEESLDHQSTVTALGPQVYQQSHDEDLEGFQSAESLIHDASTAEADFPSHAAAYLPAKQATGRDDGKEALSQKERYVDKVWIRAWGGTGGDGCVSYEPQGRGRNLVAVGGTGAAGGAVILVANARAVSMRGIPSVIHAPRGGAGGRNGRSGHIGPDRIIEVPLGTVVRLLPARDEEDEEEDERLGDGNESEASVEEEGEVVGEPGSRIRHMGGNPAEIQGPPRGRSESKGNRGIPAYSAETERRKAAAASAPMGDAILGSEEEEEKEARGGRRAGYRVWGQRARKQTEARALQDAREEWLAAQPRETFALDSEEDEQAYRQRQQQRQRQGVSSSGDPDEDQDWRREQQQRQQRGMYLPGFDSSSDAHHMNGGSDGYSRAVRRESLFSGGTEQEAGDVVDVGEVRRGRQRQRRPSAAQQTQSDSTPMSEDRSFKTASEREDPADSQFDWGFNSTRHALQPASDVCAESSKERETDESSNTGGRRKRGSVVKQQRVSSQQALLDSMSESDWLAASREHQPHRHGREVEEEGTKTVPTRPRSSRISHSSGYSGGPSGSYSTQLSHSDQEDLQSESIHDGTDDSRSRNSSDRHTGSGDRSGSEALNVPGSDLDVEQGGVGRSGLSARYRAGAGGIEIVGEGAGLTTSEQDLKAAARAERRRVREEAAVEIADLSMDGQRLVLAAGGSGGRGNMALPNPGPNRAASSCKELGEEGALVEVILESKSLADVGFVGMPNAGKSTLLAALTAARAQIGSYAFTTLRPQVGALHFEDDDTLLLLADIPGLLGGAHANIGRGNAFLRHVERTRCLAFIVDLSGGSGPGSLLQLTAAQQLTVLQDEVTRYRAFLSDLPALVIANKVDATPNPAAALAALKGSTTLPIVPVSGVSGVGLTRLKSALRMVAGRAPLPAATGAAAAAASGSRSAVTVGPQRFTVNDMGKVPGRQRDRL